MNDIFGDTSGELDGPLATAPHSFSLDEALQDLEDIREEVEETCAVTDDVIAVPEPAYQDAHLLLSLDSRFIVKSQSLTSCGLKTGGLG